MKFPTLPTLRLILYAATLALAVVAILSVSWLWGGAAIVTGLTWNALDAR